jgi:hypothetical protein
VNAPAQGGGAYCRFRDCSKEAQPGHYFCRFHLGADGFSLDGHSLGAVRAVERTLKQQPDHSDTKRYALAIATTLTKWFGDEAKLVSAECTRILEAMR